MTLKGRPEENSTIGESVKSPMKCLKNPSPDLEVPDCMTALVTQRWRWSFTELDRSRLGKRLSWGSSGDCKSVESSMALYQELPLESWASTLLKATGTPKPIGYPATPAS